MLQKEEIITIILAIIAVLPLWWDKFFSPRVMTASAHKNNADAFKAYEEAATQRLERIEKLTKRLDEAFEKISQLEEENEKLKDQISEVVNENTCLREENGILRDWAEQLVAQVKSLDGVPVSLNKKKE